MSKDTAMKTLNEAYEYILFDRNCFYESITTTDGLIQSARDQFDLDAVDKLLGEFQEAIKELQ